ncbi:LysR family transcriptional regulator [Arenibacterium sp. CAU 1754]
MNWQSVTYDWNQVRAFLATVEEGSLSAGAKALGVTQPTLGRQVAALEEALGVVLFDRVGRSLRLTPTGADLLEHVRTMRDAAQRISLAASGQSQAVAGHVVISASDVLSAHILPPIVKRLRALAPGITLEIIASNELSDLGRRDADIAIRHVRPEQPDLIARLARESEARLYASTEWIAANGRPETRGDLEQADFVGFDRSGRLIAWLKGQGITVTEANMPVLSLNGVTGWELIKQGLGVGVMLAELGDATPSVERILPDLAPVVVPFWLLTHRELHTSRRIRLVYDTLAETLSGQL